MSVQLNSIHFRNQKLRARCFFILQRAHVMKEEIRTGHSRSERNSPVDCFGARVRAASGSEAGKSLQVHHIQQPPLQGWLLFVKMKRFEQAASTCAAGGRRSVPPPVADVGTRSEVKNQGAMRSATSEQRDILRATRVTRFCPQGRFL